MRAFESPFQNEIVLLPSNKNFEQLLVENINERFLHDHSIFVNINNVPKMWCNLLLQLNYGKSQAHFFSVLSLKSEKQIKLSIASWTDL